MKVFLTGATGLVGAHTGLALLEAGHQLRLLVRDQRIAQAWFAERGYQIDDWCVADMRDREAVAKGIEGCDAVVHAAAVVSLDTRQGKETMAANLAGVDSVITAAVGMGIQKILYVSSVAIFMHPQAKSLREDGSLAVMGESYSGAKIACEQKVRALQTEGAPVTISYPATVIGPDDPRLSESNGALSIFVNRFIPITTSGMQIVDARDLAKAHVQLLEDVPRGNYCNRRYVVGGHFITWPELATAMSLQLERPLRRLHIPAVILRWSGMLMDVLRKLIPIQFPLSSESARLVTSLVPADSRRIIKEYGFKFRPTSETLADTLVWLADSNHIPAQR